MDISHFRPQTRDALANLALEGLSFSNEELRELSLRENGTITNEQYRQQVIEQAKAIAHS